MGTPGCGAYFIFGLPLFVIIVPAVLFLIFKKNRDYFIFILSLTLWPIIIILIFNRKYIYLRYFLLLFPFYYLLVSYGLSFLFKRKKISLIIAVMIVSIVVIGNCVKIYSLLSVGRGSYLEPMNYIANHSENRQCQVSSDFDFRNHTILTFYEKYLPMEFEMHYIPQRVFAQVGPEWYIMHRSKYEREPEDSFNVKNRTYRLMKKYDSVEYSGFRWYLFQLTNKRQDE